MSYASQSIGIWRDWVPSFTGFSAPPVLGLARYTLIGKMCTIYFRASAGTSNATTYTMTLPFVSSVLQFGFGVATNNSTAQSTPGMIRTQTGTNICDFFLNATGAAWTASGTKLIQFHFTYEIS